MKKIGDHLGSRGHFGSRLGRFWGSFGVGDHFGSCTVHVSEIYQKITVLYATFIIAVSCFVNQDPVVRKPISANPGLKINRGFYFSCLKIVFRANFKLEMNTSQSGNRRLKIF